MKTPTTNQKDTAAPGSVQPDCSATPFQVLTVIAFVATIAGLAASLTHNLLLDAAAFNLAAACLWLRGLTSDKSQNDGTQRPGSPDVSLATETRKPGSLK